MNIIRMLAAAGGALALGLAAGPAGAQTAGPYGGPHYPDPRSDTQPDPRPGPDRPPEVGRYDVGITKTVRGPVVSGQTATFTLSPYNVGPSPVNAGSGVTLTDTLSAGFTGPVTASGGGWSCQVMGVTINCVYVGGPVGPGGAMGTITVTAKVDGRVFVNCAEIGVKIGRDVNLANNRSCVEGPVKPDDGGGRYDVRIRKDGPLAVAAGQMATFVLSPYNAGAPVNSGSGVTVVDTLPSNFVPPVTIVAPGWTCIPSGLLVTCTYVGPPVGSNAPLPTITLSARARAPGGFTNCADISLKVAKDANPRDNRDCAEGKVTAEAKGYDVGIRKQVREPVIAGQSAVFTLNPYNTGPAPVNGSTGVIVVDILPANFVMPITASGSGWNCSVTGSGPYTVTCSYGGPSVGANTPMPPITINAMAKGPGGYQNCAEIGLKAADDLNPRDNRGCIDGKVTDKPGGKPDVSLTKTVLNGPWTWPNGAGAYELKIINSGSTAIPAGHTFQITDYIPAGMSFAGASNAWSCSPGVGAVGPTAVTCTYVSPVGLAPGAWIAMTFQVAFHGDKQPRYENCAEVRVFNRKDAWKEADLKNNRDCEPTEVIGGGGSPFDIGINKEGPEVVQVGQTATFTLTPFNAATVPLDFYTPQNPPPFVTVYPIIVTVTDTLPPGFSLVSVGGTNWNCVPAGNGFTCTYTGSGVFGPGQPLPPITVTTTANKPGKTENCAQAAIGGSWFIVDLNPTNNKDCVPIVIRPKGPENDVATRKTALEGTWTWPTGTGVFRIEVVNTGTSPVPAGHTVEIVESVPAGMTFLSAPAPWVCTPALPMQGPAQTTCSRTLPTALAPGASLTVDFQFGFHGDKRPRYENCAAVRIVHRKALWPEATLENNRDCEGIEVKDGGPYDVMVEKKGPTGPVNVGQTVTFALYPGNLGPASVSAANGITVTDTLPSAFLPPATVNAGPDWNCTASGLSVSCTYIGTAVFGINQGMPPINISAVAGVAGQVRNCAFIALERGREIAEDNNKGCAPVTIEAQRYNLSLDKSQLGQTWNSAGGVYRLLVTNAGGAPIPAGTVLTITDDLPAGMRFDNVQAPYVCTPVGLLGPAQLTCTYTLTSPLAAGGTLNLDLTVNYLQQVQASYVNCAALAVNLAETTTTDNRDCVTSTRPNYDLQIDKQVSPGPWIYPGGGGQFTLVITNNGVPIPAGSTLHFTDLGPDGLVLSAPPSPWTCMTGTPLNCDLVLSSVLGTGQSVTVTLPATFEGELRDAYPNCARVYGVVNGVQLLETIPFANNEDCVQVTPTSASPPSFVIEKVVEEDCTGSVPNTACKFMIRIFNTSGAPYTGPLTFTDLVTSQGYTIGGVSLASPLPPGWTCSGAQPATCSTTSVTIGAGGYVTIPLYMTVNGPVPPTQNCASLTAPAAAGPACTPMGSTHYDLGLDSNFLAPVTQAGTPPMAELDYVISASPALPVGSQVILTGSLTGGTTFSPWLIAGTPWTCSGTWASFLCTHTVTSTSFSSGFLWLRMKTTYPGVDIGHPFTYVGSVTMNNNADPVNSNNSRTVPSTLP